MLRESLGKRLTMAPPDAGARPLCLIYRHDTPPADTVRLRGVSINRGAEDFLVTPWASATSGDLYVRFRQALEEEWQLCGLGAGNAAGHQTALRTRSASPLTLPDRPHGFEAGGHLT